MYSLIKTHQDIMPSGIFLDKTAVSSVQRTTMRSNVLSNNTLKMLLLFIISFFSHMAHSADPVLCEPTGGMRRIYINANITITPAGLGAGIVYTNSTPLAQPGPITCPGSTPTAYSVFTMGSDLSRYPSATAFVDMSQGFQAVLGISNTPGMSGAGRAGTLVTVMSGNTANIPSNIYPSIEFYPSGSPADSHDIDLHNYFIGYIATEGVVKSDIVTPSDKTGLTGVYLSGHIHIPPYCTYMSDQPYLSIPMGTYFASDFAAAGVGGKVGQPQRIAGHGECTGGSSHGDGDLVHISVGSLTPGDGNDTLGIADQPDIGVQVFDDQGNKLPVNGGGGITSGSVHTTSSLKGETYIGEFDFPLNFQLVSRTGKAPSQTGTFTEYVTIDLFMD